MSQIPMMKPDPDPKQCPICKERFTEEWMATRCAAQGNPPILYHAADVLLTGTRRMVVVDRFIIHHAVGVKCHVEGPCPHDVSYYGYELKADLLGLERAYLLLGRWEDWRHIRYVVDERVTTLLDLKRQVIPESGRAEEYLANIDPQAEWKELWKHYPERRGRRGGRRFI